MIWYAFRTVHVLVGTIEAANLNQAESKADKEYGEHVSIRSAASYRSELEERAVLTKMFNNPHKQLNHNGPRPK